MSYSSGGAPMYCHPKKVDKKGSQSKSQMIKNVQQVLDPKDKIAPEKVPVYIPEKKVNNTGSYILPLRADKSGTKTISQAVRNVQQVLDPLAKIEPERVPVLVKSQVQLDLERRGQAEDEAFEATIKKREKRLSNPYFEFRSKFLANNEEIKKLRAPEQAKIISQAYREEKGLEVPSKSQKKKKLKSRGELTMEEAPMEIEEVPIEVEESEIEEAPRVRKGVPPGLRRWQDFQKEFKERNPNLPREQMKYEIKNAWELLKAKERRGLA